MPLCLDTEHISDYGFTVKINELHWGDTGWQKRLWWKWASWRSGTVFSHYLGILSRPIFNHSIIAVWRFCISLHLTSNTLLDLTLSDITERHVGYRVMKIKRWPEGSDLIICGSSVQISEVPCDNLGLKHHEQFLSIKKQVCPCTFFVVCYSNWDCEPEQPLKDIIIPPQLIGNEFNRALHIASLDLIKAGQYWNQCIKCSVDMRSGSSSLFSSSWWRQDLCNRWNPLTIMRAWQLWHFDDADIHIPEHKGEEMKKPLTPPSVPAPPPPQLTIYHRPCLLLLPKYTTPKPTNKRIKSKHGLCARQMHE